MKQIIIGLFFCLLSTITYSKPGEVIYHQIGDWKIADSLKSMNQKDFFKKLVKHSKTEYSGQVKTPFSDQSKVKFIFKNNKLLTTITSLYDGNSEDDALNTLKKTIKIFEEKYGGANFEGLSTSKGLKTEHVDTIIKQLKTQSDNFFQEQSKEDPDNNTTYNLYLQLWNEFPAKNNFLYVKFSYIGETGEFHIDLYEDKKLNTKNTYGCRRPEPQ